MVGDVPSFGFGSACCIEDFLVGLFFLPDEGGNGRGPTKGAAFRISFHFTSLNSREGKGREERLFSMRIEKGGVSKSVTYLTEGKEHPAEETTEYRLDKTERIEQNSANATQCKAAQEE